ncbi:MAG: FlgD immunoglobulin-like domain containing protein, partial [bacterium]
IAGKLRSQPLVILSDNFEEYAHNYPNPFRAGSELTRIAYIMEKAASVSVKIYDLAGSLVYDRQYGVGETGTAQGPQEVTWDGRNMNGEVVRNGVYICQLQAGGRSTRIRIAVAK